MSEQIQEVALTEEEKDTILSYCGPEPLLVGGQALAFWAVWFKIENPAELGDKITTDADFLGSSKNARDLNKQLHWTMWTPSLDDSTPQTAKLTKSVEYNGIKQIDFLHSIVAEEMSENGSPVTVTRPRRLSRLPCALRARHDDGLHVEEGIYTGAQMPAECLPPSSYHEYEVGAGGDLRYYNPA